MHHPPDQEKYLPVFAYGSLMPGQSNYFIWEHYITHTEPAVFVGGRLHNLGDFPMISEWGDGLVRGFLVEISPTVYQQCLEDLDYLENYQPDDLENSLYYRLERQVQRADGIFTPAWVFVGNPAVSSRYPVIPSGDWREAVGDEHQGNRNNL